MNMGERPELKLLLKRIGMTLKELEHVKNWRK
jgi:hypothetical protein